ncbi:DUF294 nucleotidyltransferase-like domain-containing protein [Bacillus sp. REN16]|uniref:DUF294 nucleotidyltransferase-like domain-containing protein n=1 Tax=Bacillus sp. REN16 TaxID=2887296 RepID=UPI001E3B4AF3|nr:DUF294 nucleotidyltransferase-like domain-containing protein [Bacillus sp. REN16]MCC3358139.1 DUF294 nucleotidyltransferase-like domain-containing protein [Bacillus sp. REN16]
MQGLLEPYQSIKKWHNDNVLAQQINTDKLHLIHDFVMKNVCEITLKEMMKDYGTPPCEFSWFVMGSAGRCEQAVISDQDHGIIYEEDNESAASYFFIFGKRLVSALDYVGYPLCEGDVMSSNPLWCQSKRDWEIQIKKWIHDDTWKSLRYLLIFYDARVVVGEEKGVQTLKNIIYQTIEKQPSVLVRLLENTKHTVKAIGLFNQFLTVSSGPYTGYIDLKMTALFPYVNAVRLLSIIEKIDSTSTLARMESLCLSDMYVKIMDTHHSNFKKLMYYRLLHDDAKGYESGHYLNIKRLNKLEKLEIKQILKDVGKIQRFSEWMVQGAIKNER